MSSTLPSPPVVFEPEFISGLREVFERSIPFNQLLGLRIDDITPEQVSAHLEMRPELVGHFTYQRLHGGVISTGLDATGGLAVMAALGARHMADAPLARLQRFARLGTIDLRVDYLRAALKGPFQLRAQVLRLGSRVANTRMEFLGPQGELLASGAAAYIVS
ncbi:uncharacterized domain 1-containing protein [Oryzisolibacter propanilivorax]|uniref:Uncharacterized domain 1-containing protein n=1 Tax=Oryzisolibacter propanilivorax TaxID=1527607 RepID=A0A1G9S544_9BURK|nr:thioesterase family protein [Oryzisolibacter propanilivorax]SDM29865.1 uncharacterized domain 1-containing protein [Oryzisolibacter propanilivorax]